MSESIEDRFWSLVRKRNHEISDGPAAVKRKCLKCGRTFRSMEGYRRCSACLRQGQKLGKVAQSYYRVEFDEKEESDSD